MMVRFCKNFKTLIFTIMRVRKEVYAWSAEVIRSASVEMRLTAMNAFMVISLF